MNDLNRTRQLVNRQARWLSNQLVDPIEARKARYGVTIVGDKDLQSKRGFEQGSRWVGDFFRAEGAKAVGNRALKKRRVKGTGRNLTAAAIRMMIRRRGSSMPRRSASYYDLADRLEHLPC